LIKAIELFNAAQLDEASLLLKELATGCSNADTRAFHTLIWMEQRYSGVEFMTGLVSDVMRSDPAKTSERGR